MTQKVFLLTQLKGDPRQGENSRIISNWFLGPGGQGDPWNSGFFFFFLKLCTYSRILNILAHKGWERSNLKQFLWKISRDVSKSDKEYEDKGRVGSQKLSRLSSSTTDIQRAAKPSPSRRHGPGVLSEFSQDTTYNLESLRMCLW